MARNNPKPTDKLDWIPDDTTNISEPLPSKKATGWLFGEKPPNNVFNFITNLINRILDYAMGQVEDWIVIDSDADEGDYATLAAYIADSPAVGDRILIKEDQTVTVQTVIPSDITLKFLDGARLLSSTNIATSVLQLGSNIIIEGVLKIVLNQTGTTDKAVEYNGDNVVGQIDVENSSTGTLTTAHNLNAEKTGNQIKGFVANTGGGTLTNILVDNSTEDSNNIELIDDANNKVVRSRGAYKFRDGMEFDLGSDVDGDIYYRDAGILKRLAKGTDGKVLELASGLPSWQARPNASTIVKGVVELATGAEVKAGTDPNRVAPVSGMIQHEGVVKGWINFDGTGTVAIRESYNVSSIIDEGVGDYTINWNTDFANNNYAAAGMSGSGANTFVNWASQSVGSLRINISDADGLGSKIDVDNILVIAIGDQ